LDPFGLLYAPGMLFLAWLLMVAAMTWAKLPGVICLTPVAWLLATAVGRGAVRYSRSRHVATLRREAAIAGAVFGFLVGGLYLLYTLVVFRSEPDTYGFAIVSGSGFIVCGMGVCAGLSLGTAALTIRRIMVEQKAKPHE